MWLSTLWFATCRVVVRDGHYIDEVQDNAPAIVPFWHYSIFYIFHHLRKYQGVVLVSASRDGEFVARIAERLDFETVRGSSNRQSVQALKKLLRAMKAGKHLGIVADGSQGPARILQPGAIYLAAKTGAPIFPLVWSASRFIAFKSWDRTLLPLPFSRIVMRYGKPVYLPNDLSDEALEKHRKRVEKQLNELYRQVWSEFEKERHDRD